MFVPSEWLIILDSSSHFGLHEHMYRQLLQYLFGVEIKWSDYYKEVNITYTKNTV
jgi:hypothetical protein